MNHYHSWSWPSALPSPRSRFLVCTTRSHEPESLEVTVDAGEVGGGGQRPLVDRDGAQRGKERRCYRSQPRTVVSS